MGAVASDSGVGESRPPVVLLVACSLRKRIPTEPRLKLRTVASGDPLARLEEWKARLIEIEAPSVPAQDLYAGDHWSSTRRAFEMAQEWNPSSSLWVLSAGYGIVAAETALKSYGATLASEQPDSISPVGSAPHRRQAATKWWNGLSHESSLARLLDDPCEPVLFIAGGSEYVEVLRSDIEAAEHRGWYDRLFVVSAGSREVPGALPVRGAHSKAVGGSMAALNARLLAFLMNSAHEHRFVRHRMEEMLEALKRTTVRRLKPRRSMSDAEVAAAIATFHATRPSLTYTSALRALRDQGMSCERLRFKAVWLEATSVS